MDRIPVVAFRRLGLWIAFLCCIQLPTAVLAGDKLYPVDGSVTALGTNQETSGGDTTPIITHQHRTYTVRTPGRDFVLECPYWMDGFHIHAPSECGGKKKIEIGDTVHFRVEKRHAYLKTTGGKEQKLAVLSEAANEDTAQAVKQ